MKIRAKADADAAEMQALSITKLAEANREAGLKEAEVLRQKNAAANSKSQRDPAPGGGADACSRARPRCCASW